MVEAAEEGTRRKSGILVRIFRGEGSSVWRRGLAAPLRRVRDARIVIAIPTIDHHRHHIPLPHPLHRRRGHRAPEANNVPIVITPSPYADRIVYLITWTLGEAAPGAAPTPRKRSPWRPPRMGRQGKLPFWTAIRCRGFLWYLLPYLNMINTRTSLARSMASHLTCPLVVMGRLAGRARAMVRGMAMATAAETLRRDAARIYWTS